MKDIHSHILYDIDDGARTIDESINILEKMYNFGVTDIILTPHYIKNSNYVANNKIRKKRLTEIKKRFDKINLYLGNEVYIDEDIVDLIKKREISTLNDSNYLLIEFPMDNIVKDVDEVIYDLMRNGIIPIIAHPERYTYVQKNIEYLNKFLDAGVLLQGNYESLFGKYGTKAKKTLKKLLKKGYITFLGSDIHREDRECHVSDLYKKLKKIIKDENIINDLIDGNIQKVIDNEEIK